MRTLQEIFARWVGADPHVFEFVTLPPDGQGPTVSEPIGYTCVLPMTEDTITEDSGKVPGSYSLYIDGLLSEWDIGPAHLRCPGVDPVRSLCIQAVTLTRNAWLQLYGGRRWQPAAARSLLETLVRHASHYNRVPFQPGSELRIVADGNLRGIALLKSHWFAEMERPSKDGRALFQLDFSWHDQPEVDERSRQVIRSFGGLIGQFERFLGE